MYIDLSPMLSCCRKFNILLGGRGIGKTYGLQRWLISRCVRDRREIGYIVRNKIDFYNDGLRASWGKVLGREFPDLIYRAGNTLIEYQDESGEWRELVHGIALSEVQMWKRKPIERIDYLFFDEFLIDYTSCAHYLRGNCEPDIVLSLYDSIDRNENRVVLFMAGNNDFSYTPYSIHKAFSTPVLGVGQRYLTKELCAINFATPDELAKAREYNALNQITKGTRYNDFAFKGERQYNGWQIVGPQEGKPSFTLKIDDTVYGLFKRSGNFIFSVYTGQCDADLCVTDINNVEGGKSKLLSNQTIKALKRLDGAGRLYYDTQITLEIIREVLY